MALAAAALLVAGSAACAAPIEVNGVKVTASIWAHAQQSIGASAAFDMKCPRTELKLTPIDTGSLPYDFQVGVTGCGQSARYVFVPGAGWIANTETTKK